MAETETQAVEAPNVIRRITPVDASNIIDQRKESARWLNENYYKEWEETYRTAKARVKMITKRNAKGEDVEDKSRTNICFPDHFNMIRHGKARLTRNPPNLRMRCESKDAGDKMSALLMYQWDKGESQNAFSKITHASKMLGIGVGKTYYDKVVIDRLFRKYTNSLTAEELKQFPLEGEDGAGSDSGEGSEDYGSAGQGSGETPAGNAPALPPERLARITAQYGDKVSVKTPITKFEGCVLADVFPGDWFPEPGFRSGDESAYHIENSIRDEDWLEYWSKQVTVDPDGGAEISIFDPKAVEDLMKTTGDGRNTLDRRDMSLRRNMREAVKLSDPSQYNNSSQKGSRKRFVIDERHTIKDGRLVIEYVGDENIYLGKQWYPYETYGRYLYTFMILIPDLLGGIGDSTPRISKFLMQMRNNRGNQINDFINNKLAPIMKALEGSNWTEEDLQRLSFARVLRVKSMGELENLNDPQFPPEAWQDLAMIVREMQQVEPSISDFAPGTDAIPQSGKLATTAILQQKSADAILADELNQMNQFVRDTMELWVPINQQAMQDDLNISKGDAPRVDMLMAGINGQPRKITINPMEIQQEMQVLPEAGSTLAADDEYKVKALQQLVALGAQFPDIIDNRYAITELVKAMPGVNPEQAIKPPAPPPPPPPKPPNVSVGVAVKWPELAPDVQEALLQKAELPTTDTHVLGMVHHATETVGKIAGAADAADRLQSPATAATPPDDGEPKVPTPAGMKGVGE